jgi:hypothetical protein
MYHGQQVVSGSDVRTVILALAVLPIILVSAPSVRADSPEVPFQEITGIPLDIACFDTGQMAAYVWDATANEGEGEYVGQYYSDDSWGSVLFFDNGDTTLKYGNPYHKGIYDYEYEEGGMATFTAVSNTMPSDWEADTVMGAGESGVTVTQKVQYTNGAAYYKMTWTITNGSGTTYTNCTFIHGGDAYFADNDDAQSYWDDNLGMVYLRNPGLSGLMGFYGGLGSRADGYNGGDYYDGDVMAVAGELDNTVDPEFIDCGYHLQWNRASFAPGETWTITAYEKWTEAGDVQVMAPAEQTATKGDTVSLSFVVQNFQADTDTFDLEAASDLGWPVSLPDGDTVTLDAGQSATITVDVIVPAESESWEDTITLTATSQATEGVTNSDSVMVTGTDSGEPPVPPVDNPTTVSRHHGGSWCFISTAEASSSSAGILILIACIFLGLGSLIRRRSV